MSTIVSHVYLWWVVFLEVLVAYSCSILYKTSIEQPSASSLESLFKLIFQTTFSHFCTEQLVMQEEVKEEAVMVKVEMEKKD